VLAAPGLSGCGRSEAVTSYRVPKQKLIEAENHLTPEDRVLGAIIPRGETAWFFKATGPANELDNQAAAFRKFIESVKFDGPEDTPTWTTPAAWRETKSSGIRLATIELGEGQGMSVTRLPMRAGSGEELYVLANINRWRTQLKLSQLELHDLAKETDRVPVDGALALVVNFAGQLDQSSAMAAAPFASGAPPRRPAAPSRPPQAATPKLTYAKPPGWRPGRMSSMRKAAFVAGDGDSLAEITVIDLPRDANDVFSNVNRWRGQVGLAPIARDQLDDATRRIEAGPVGGDYFPLYGDEKAILGTILFVGDKAWFVKLTGPAVLAKSEQSNYEEFVESLRFDPPPAENFDPPPAENSE
jgi:hypothetical protein